MAHPSLDVLALIALGEDVEADAIGHVGECRACFAEIEALQQVVAVGRSLTASDQLTAPHPRVWQRIASGVRDGRTIPLPGAVTLRHQPPSVPPGESRPVALGGTTRSSQALPPRRRRRLSPALAAAVALVVGLGGGLGVSRALDLRPGDSPVTQLNALPEWAGANGTASIEEGANGQRTLVVSVTMPPTAHLDGSLEVWMSDSQALDMVPMGMMSGQTGRFPIAAGMDLASHSIVDVSLEPAGDKDPVHSDTSIVRGRLRL